MLVGVDVSEEDDSDLDSSCQIWLSRATSTAASSSSLGEPRCLRARPILMISSICLMYVSLWSMLLRTLVMAARRAWLVAMSSVKGMECQVLPSGDGVQMVGLGCMVEGAGGMFSLYESLSSLGEGSLG